MGEYVIDNADLSEQVTRILTSRIIEGKIRPGSRLVINRIADELGVSSTPVRDALARLISSGYAMKDPRGSVYVINLSPQDGEEIYDLREVLEGLAVRLVIGRVEVGVLQDLRKEFQTLRDAIAKHEGIISHEEDVTLHDTIVANCPNRRLRRQIRLIMNQSYLLRFLQHQSKLEDLSSRGASRRLAEETDEHIEIVDAMIEGDGGRAEELMRHHIRNAKKDFFQHVRKPAIARKAKRGILREGDINDLV